MNGHGGILHKAMDMPEMVFKGAAGIIGATTLWVTRTVIGHNSRIAVLESQRIDDTKWRESMAEKLDKIIDLHMKANGGSK